LPLVSQGGETFAVGELARKLDELECPVEFLFGLIGGGGEDFAGGGVCLGIWEVFEEHGFSQISKRLASEIVPKAITDCKRQGEATIFDCLFSDTQRYHDDTVRFSDNELPGTYPGSMVSWHERFDRKGNVKDRYTWIEYSSGDCVTIFLDKKSRITKIRFTRKLKKQKKEEMVLDVEKRIHKMKRDKRKNSK